MFIDKSMTTNVITIGEEASLTEAREKMEKNKIRHLPVVDGENYLVGIVTDRDVRSALPSSFLTSEDYAKAHESFGKLKVKDIMARNVITLNETDTIQDALLITQKIRVGAFPVVDRDGKLVGMLSVRDLLRAFINVLNIEEPGKLLGILAEDKQGQTKKIVDAITEEGIPFGSILVARRWDGGKRAVFTYLLSNNVTKVKKKLESLGFTLINPLDWSLDRRNR